MQFKYENISIEYEAGTFTASSINCYAFPSHQSLK